MTNTSKSWLYAFGVTLIFLCMLLITSPAHATQSDAFITAAPMQLARGGNFLIPSPRRTQATPNAQNQTDAVSKDSNKDQRGLQGPAGKTPTEEGSNGTKNPQPIDVNQS